MSLCAGERPQALAQLQRQKVESRGFLVGRGRGSQDGAGPPDGVVQRKSKTVNGLTDTASNIPSHAMMVSSDVERTITCDLTQVTAIEDAGRVLLHN